MSRALIDRSPDLARLDQEGFCLRVVDDALLVVDGVPYLTGTNEVARASLVMPLTLSGDRTAKPADHVAYWTGSPPFAAKGGDLSGTLAIGQGGSVGPFTSVFMFSARADYIDYHHKVTAYVEHLEREARLHQPGVMARYWNGSG